MPPTPMAGVVWWTIHSETKAGIGLSFLSSSSLVEFIRAPKSMIWGLVVLGGSFSRFLLKLHTACPNSDIRIPLAAINLMSQLEA